jgi:superfamily II DNA helicase RecQ
VMQEEFIEHNKLIRPRIICESTNRPNVKYIVSLETRTGTLIERAAALVQEFWPRQEIFDHAQDKIIIYCRSRDEVYDLAAMLKCPSYTSESGSEEERATIIS